MNIAALFVRRPVMTLLVMIGILAFGLVAYRLLPVNALPNVDFPSIQVQAQLPGANPETMAFGSPPREKNSCAGPIERRQCYARGYTRTVDEQVRPEDSQLSRVR